MEGATEVAAEAMVAATTTVVVIVVDTVAVDTVDMVVRENDTRKMMGLEGLIRGGQVRMQAGSGSHFINTNSYAMCVCF